MLFQIIKTLTLGLPAALKALRKWLCALFAGKIVVAGADQCDTLTSTVVRYPDPLIYDQYYLMSLGLPVTWENPDISVWLGGVQVSPSDLVAGSTYQVVARIWNNSTDAPVAGLVVIFSYLSFGVGTQSHPIGQTKVNLGVKGGPDHPAFAVMAWTTPSVPGHYCIQVTLDPASDANWFNNLGQENTQVVAAQSPAVSSFALRNDTDERQTYVFRVDSYSVRDLPPCPAPVAGIAAAPVALTGRLASLTAQPNVAPVPLPPGWAVTLVPDAPDLAAGAEATVQVTITPPSGFTGNQVVNIHVLRTSVDRRQPSAILAGGVTFTVSVS